MEHTKGKLIRHDFWLDLDENRKPPISIGAVCKVEISDEEAIANAEHLIKCWNEYDALKKKADSHDAFLDVCRNALITTRILRLPRMDNNVATNDELLVTMAKSLEQAIAQAEK